MVVTWERRKINTNFVSESKETLATRVTQDLPGFLVSAPAAASVDTHESVLGAIVLKLVAGLRHPAHLFCVLGVPAGAEGHWQSDGLAMPVADGVAMPVHAREAYPRVLRVSSISEEFF